LICNIFCPGCLIRKIIFGTQPWGYILVAQRQKRCQKMEKMIGLNTVCQICKGGVPVWKMR
ncbi:hypothetical protein KI387_017758, partial [Taxus chinensis]